MTGATEIRKAINRKVDFDRQEPVLPNYSGGIPLCRRCGFKLLTLEVPEVNFCAVCGQAVKHR